MATSTTIFDYLGVGVLADRPVTPNINSSGTAVYYATDGTPHAYMWNGSAWVQIDGATSFASASDAAIVGLANNDFLAYNSGTSKWTNRTVAAVTALLNAVVGDSGSGGTKGLVPAPGAGDAAAGKFLKADATYAIPAGTGITTLAAATDAAITAPATNDILVYVASKWTNERQRYDLAFSAPQTTAYSASQVVGAHRFSAGVTIPANFGAYLTRTSKAGGSAVTTASTVFNVDKAASATPNTFSNVGTITFALGTVTPTFASSGGTAITFAAGDVIRIVAPASADATFAGFYCTLVGFET